MNILVVGGTRYFGIHTVRELLKSGHTVTIANRGKTGDNFGASVGRIIVDRSDAQLLTDAFRGKRFDVVCDSLAYCSNDVKYLLDAVACDRYIMTSSTAVYQKHINTKESDFDARQYPLKWCGRMDYPYDEIKRQAECALFQTYGQQDSAAVRLPFVIGSDDYTKRLYFYVEHTVRGLPMNVDNLDAHMGFIRSDEVGRFIAWLAGQDYTGPINGSGTGTLSPAEIIRYVESKTHCRAVISPDGDKAPYNSEPDYTINTDLAESLGFVFTPLHDWIDTLLDEYIERASL